MRLGLLIILLSVLCFTWGKDTKGVKTKSSPRKKAQRTIVLPDGERTAAGAVGQSAAPLPLSPMGSNDGDRDPKLILRDPQQGADRSFNGLRSIRLWVDAHNRERSEASAAMPLQWDRKIARFAQRHAESISHQTNCTPDFNEDNGEYGENLFWGIYEYGLRKWTITDAVAQWAKQKDFYDYATNTCEAGQSCAAYLQVVWNETKRIGCAEVFCPFKGEFHGVAQFFVCNYSPGAAIAPGHRQPY